MRSEITENFIVADFKELMQILEMIWRCMYRNYNLLLRSPSYLTTVPILLFWVDFMIVAQ